MKIFKRILLGVLVGVLLYCIQYIWRAIPILTGYGAKILCSCAYIGERKADDIIANELSPFPISLGTFHLQPKDFSATAHVFGLAKKKAIYRKGLGCTLINDITEEELRAQPYTLPLSVRVNTDTIDWPAGDRLPDSLPKGLDVNAMEAALDYAFEEPGATPRRRTRAIVVVYDGQLVAERYADGFTRHSKLAGWSMAKSLTNALVGVLIDRNQLAVDQPAPIDHWKDDERSAITLGHLLHATSGLEWTEVYGGPSEATTMLFKRGDTGAFAAGQPLENPPGSDFYYSSGTSNILSMIVRKTVAPSPYYSFPYEEVFHRIGMYSLVLEPDASGTFVGSSFAHATARDWARFGLLYYNRGLFNGKRILSENWVRYSTTPSSAAGRGEYGAQIWLNAGKGTPEPKRLYPRLPRDLFWADGYEGQNVFVIPSKKLVVVKLSLTHSDALDDEEFLLAIMGALPK